MSPGQEGQSLGIANDAIALLNRRGVSFSPVYFFSLKPAGIEMSASTTLVDTDTNS
jgi:hypothetical protein